MQLPWLSFNVVDGDAWRVRPTSIEGYWPAYPGKADGPSMVRTMSGMEVVVTVCVSYIDEAFDELARHEDLDRLVWQKG